ncbi:MAG: DUF2577 domain-containing protein [Clostridia bacterium]|nr:DUF2577 domain-containing protein [Clostridia bacterium]
MDFSDIVFGEVLSQEPLTIKISDKIILNQNQIILSKNVSNHYLQINDNPKYLNNPNNEYDFSNKKNIIVYNYLKTGEKVMLIKAVGGQSYFVIDRVFN